MTDWLGVLKTGAPNGNPTLLNGMDQSMPAVIKLASLTTPLRIAHHLAQCAHESGGFQFWHEIASGSAYNGRRDLGNVRPGDGQRFRGTGDIEVTGRANYRAVGKIIGVDLENHPELALSFPTWALMGAAFWTMHPELNTLADRDDVRGISHIVNGGWNGLSSRIAYSWKFKKALGVK